MLKLATDEIIVFSTKPLKIIGGIGFISVVISVLILIYALLNCIFSWDVIAKGWTSIMFSMTFLIGIQLMSIWLVAEYISRIYDEAKGRPQYIIDKTINIE